MQEAVIDYFAFIARLSTGRSPGRLILMGGACTVVGAVFIKRAWEGDTLLPGTLTCYVPKWIYYTFGLLLQLPLPLSYYFLKSQGYF